MLVQTNCNARNHLLHATAELQLSLNEPLGMHNTFTTLMLYTSSAED